jgi:hypothetical protein
MAVSKAGSPNTASVFNTMATDLTTQVGSDQQSNASLIGMFSDDTFTGATPAQVAQKLVLAAKSTKVKDMLTGLNTLLYGSGPDTKMLMANLPPQTQALIQNFQSTLQSPSTLAQAQGMSPAEFESYLGDGFKSQMAQSFIQGLKTMGDPKGQMAQSGMYGTPDELGAQAQKAIPLVQQLLKTKGLTPAQFTEKLAEINQGIRMKASEEASFVQNITNALKNVSKNDPLQEGSEGW